MKLKKGFLIIYTFDNLFTFKQIVFSTFFTLGITLFFIAFLSKDFFSLPNLKFLILLIRILVIPFIFLIGLKIITSFKTIRNMEPYAELTKEWNQGKENFKKYLKVFDDGFNDNINGINISGRTFTSNLFILFIMMLGTALVINFVNTINILSISLFLTLFFIHVVLIEKLIRLTSFTIKQFNDFRQIAIPLVASSFIISALYLFLEINNFTINSEVFKNINLGSWILIIKDFFVFFSASGLVIIFTIFIFIVKFFSNSDKIKLGNKDYNKFFFALSMILVSFYYCFFEIFSVIFLYLLKPNLRFSMIASIYITTMYFIFWILMIFLLNFYLRVDRLTTLWNKSNKGIFQHLEGYYIGTSTYSYKDSIISNYSFEKTIPFIIVSPDLDIEKGVNISHPYFENLICEPINDLVYGDKVAIWGYLIFSRDLVNPSPISYIMPLSIQLIKKNPYDEFLQ